MKRKPTKIFCRFMRSLLTFLISGMLIIGTLTGCKNTGGGSSAASGNYLFTINDEKFDLAEARIVFMTYQCMNESAYSEILGNSFWDKEVAKDLTFSQYMKEYCCLPELVCVKALCMMAEEKGYQIPDSAKPYLEAAANQFYYNLSKEEGEYLLLADYNTVYRTFEHYYVAHVMMNDLSADVTREISDDEARVAVVNQVFVRNRETADLVLKLLKEDKQDFGAVFEKYDESRFLTNLVNPGTNGKVNVKRNDGMDEAYYQTVYSLNTGEFSPVIQTANGFYVVYCSESFNHDLTDANKKDILDRRIYEAWHDDYLEFMKDKNAVLNQTAYEEIDFKFTEGVSNDTFFTIYDSYISDHEEQLIPVEQKNR